MELNIISANRLTDGHVVYLSHNGRWSENIVDGRTAKNEEESTALLAEAQVSVTGGLVVDPYVVSISNDNGAFEPVRLRERIRQLGPKQSKALSQATQTRA